MSLSPFFKVQKARVLPAWWVSVFPVLGRRTCTCSDFLFFLYQRVMKIDGAPDCVANAIEKIALILNSQSPEAKHRGRPTGFSDEVHEPIRLLVHDGLLAFFYDEVANLQDKSECKVVIEPEPLPNSSEKLVVFNGSPAAIRDVAEKWFKLMLSLCTQVFSSFTLLFTLLFVALFLFQEMMTPSTFFSSITKNALQLFARLSKLPL